MIIWLYAIILKYLANKYEVILKIMMYDKRDAS